MNNEKQNNQFNEEEIKEMREEVLRWIEKKEKKNPPRGRSRRSGERASAPVKPPSRLKTTFKTAQKKEKPQQLLLPKIFPKLIFKKIILAFLGTVLIFFLIISGGIYGLGWQDQLTVLVSKIIPYPAVFINGKMVSYSKYILNLKTLNFINSQQKENKIVSQKEIKKKIVSKFITDEIIRQLAKTYNVSLSEKELGENLQSLIKEIGSPQSFEKLLKELYNWRTQDFKENLLKPYLVQQKLFLAAKNNPTLLKQAENKVSQVLKQIKKEEISFEQAAKIYSEGMAAVIDGDLGYVKAGQLVKEIEEVLFNLKEGEISEIIKTEDGYSIYKIDEILKEPVAEEKIKSDEQEKIIGIKVKQILISPTQILSEIISEKVNQAKVWVLVR